MKLPKLTEQPYLHIDLVPDNDLPLRILRTYRQHCDCQWAEDLDGGEVKNPVLKIMNEHNVQRAAILDKAMALLSIDLKENQALAIIEKESELPPNPKNYDDYYTEWQRYDDGQEDMLKVGYAKVVKVL